jgi:hypothetical protein
METETERARPGPKRERHLDWVPRVEYCGECTLQIVWHEQIGSEQKFKTTNGRTHRFRRCEFCTAAHFARRRGVA